MVRKISILSVLVLFFGFISCKQNVDVKYVSVPVPVSDGGSITESGTYTVYHLKQNILGSLKPGDCTRDIQRHLQQVYGVEVSPETISNITESVMADVREWQNRPLEKS